MRLKEWGRSLCIAARNAALGGNLVSLSMLPDPRRFYDYISQCLLCYKCVADRRGVPQEHVFNAIRHDGNLSFVLPNPPAGNLWFGGTTSLFVDIVSLCLLCRLLRPTRVFEVGTFDGYSAAAMAMNCPDGAVVFTLDLPRGSGGALRNTVMDREIVTRHSGAERMAWEGTAAAGKIVQLSGDSASFDFSPYLGNIDLFFVDGAHSYEYVRSDSRNALICTRPGGAIAWHDFGRMGVNGVERAVRELVKGRQVAVVPGGSLAYVTLPPRV